MDMAFFWVLGYRGSESRGKERINTSKRKIIILSSHVCFEKLHILRPVV